MVIDWIKQAWNKDLTTLIPEKGSDIKMGSIITNIIYYATLGRLALSCLIMVCPFATLRRYLVRLSYKIFGL